MVLAAVPMYDLDLQNSHIGGGTLLCVWGELDGIRGIEKRQNCKDAEEE